MFKVILIAALIAVALADVSHLNRRPFAKLSPPTPVYTGSPKSFGDAKHAAILRQDADIDPQGSYRWSYETDNGIAAQEQGDIQVLGKDKVSKSAQGSFQWQSPEGVPVVISYIADENGYQPQGDVLPVAPTPPPIPAAIQRALDWIAAHPQPAEVKGSRF